MTSSFFTFFYQGYKLTPPVYFDVLDTLYQLFYHSCSIRSAFTFTKSVNAALAVVAPDKLLGEAYGNSAHVAMGSG